MPGTIPLNQAALGPRHSVWPTAILSLASCLGADASGTERLRYSDLIACQGPLPCGIADNAEPHGVLDLADIQGFVDAFVNQAPGADLASPNGVFDLADITAFVNSFNNGCPR